MKKILSILFLLTLGTVEAQTVLKFSDFTAETAPAGTDYLVGYRTPSVAGGNRRYSLSTLQTYFASVSQPLDADLTALAALSGTNTIYYRSAANTWSPVSFVGATFSGGVLTITGGSGSGDVSSNTSSSIDGEAAVFLSTGGKTIKRATGTGVAHLTSGVLSAAAVNLTSEVTGVLPVANYATGTPNGSKFVRDDGTLAVPGVSGVSQTQETIVSFSAAGTTTLARPSGSDFHTVFLTAAAGSGGYTRDVVINTTNAPADGDQVHITIALPASKNPTILVHSGSAGAATLNTVSNPTATADTVALDFIYAGAAWLPISNTATRVKDLPGITTSAAVDDFVELDGATNGGRKILASNLGGGGSGITALTGDVTASGTGSVAATLATSGVTAGAYGSSSLIPVITVDAKGRLTAVSTASVSGGGGSSTYGDLANYYQFVDDFDSRPYSLDGNGCQVPLGWEVGLQGSATSFYAVGPEGDHVGIGRIQTANSGSNSRFCLVRGGTAPVPGQGALTFRALIRPHLLNATVGSAYRIGFQDNTSVFTASNYGIYFEINCATGALSLKSAAAGTTSTSSTGITVSLDTWYTIEFTVNAGATSIQAKVNGTNAGSAITTNIPTAGETLMIEAFDNGSASTSTQVDADYVYIIQNFSSAR